MFSVFSSGAISSFWAIFTASSFLLVACFKLTLVSLSGVKAMTNSIFSKVLLTVYKGLFGIYSAWATMLVPPIRPMIIKKETTLVGEGAILLTQAMEFNLKVKAHEDSLPKVSWVTLATKKFRVFSAHSIDGSVFCSLLNCLISLSGIILYAYLALLKLDG